MKLLLVGSPQWPSVTVSFADAARGLGHECRLFDSERVNSGRRILVRVATRVFGVPPWAWPMQSRLLETVHAWRPDVVLVSKGPWVAPGTLRRLRQLGPRLVNFATDDPFNDAVSSRWLRQGISEYDLYCSTKRAIVDDLERAGARAVTFVPFGFDPARHFPEHPAAGELSSYECDLAFIGGADLDRVPVFEAVASCAPEIHLALYGGLWERHAGVARFRRGFANGARFRHAVAGARVNLGLVRRANRDGHAMRTFEIPACGGFMLAERTSEHEEWFTDGVHCAMFGGLDELLDKTKYYLAHPAQREQVALAGRDAVTRGGHSYLDRLAAILRVLGGGDA